MAIVQITSENYQKEVREEKMPVVLDFFADWCGPCQAIAPILSRLAGEYEGRIKVGKVNVDQSPNLASEFNVMSIPTLVFLKKGKKVNESVGAVEREELKKLFEEVLK